MSSDYKSITSCCGVHDYVCVYFFYALILSHSYFCVFFFFQAEDGIRDYKVTGVQTCALPILAVPKGFLPSEDNSQIFGTTETVEGTSFDDLVSHQLQVMAVLQQDPNVVGTMSFLGGGGTINQGRVFMQLKPRSQRRVSVDELIRYFNGKLAGIPGIHVFLQNPPPIQIGGRRTKSLYQFTLQSPDRIGLYDNATRLAAQLRKLPDLLNVTSDVQISSPQ